MAENNPTELKLFLNEGWARVEFTKADGTHRSMLCTRNFTDIPNEQHPTAGGKKINESVLNVFDLEKQAWRSIKIDSILSWKKERLIDG